MAEMDDIELSLLIQDISDFLSKGNPDRFKIEIQGGLLTFTSNVWTSAMKRDVLRVTRNLSDVRAACNASMGTGNCHDAAGAIITEFLGATFRVQTDRWRLARQYGLLSDGKVSDLPVAAMLIDTTLLKMLLTKGVDIHRTADLMTRDRYRRVGDELPFVPAGVSREAIVFARQIGIEPPIVSSWVSLARSPSISYDGTYLAFDGPLPESIIHGAPGRRLRDIVFTGIGGLDERVIKGIHRFGEHPHGITMFEEALEMYVELVPDLIPLGGKRPG